MEEEDSLVLPSDIGQLGSSATRDIDTLKESPLRLISSKTQTSPTFKLLSDANLFHPELNLPRL